MKSLKYEYYNREERALCAHLFRLLHDLIPPNRNGEEFRRFLIKSGYSGSIINYETAVIYCEVALIRDAYYARKPNTQNFMDQLVEAVATLENVQQIRTFSALPEVLKNPHKPNIILDYLSHFREGKPIRRR
jgi:hypothetical protein